VVEPMADIDTFRNYVARLNRIIKNHMPFLQAAFRISELSISIVLSNNRLVPKCLREAFFTMPGSETTVIVQYTLLVSDEESKETIKIRKFPNVRAFMDATA
jgi:hypothetical protein